MILLVDLLVATDFVFTLAVPTQVERYFGTLEPPIRYFRASNRVGVKCTVFRCVWKCCVPHCTQWLMIIIPMKNGYFMGNIPNIFRSKPISWIGRSPLSNSYFQSTPKESQDRGRGFRQSDDLRGQHRVRRLRPVVPVVFRRGWFASPGV